MEEIRIEERQDYALSARRRTFLTCAALFLAAVALRLLFLLEYRSSPTFSIPIIDSASYDEMARTFVQEGRMDPEFFWHGFLYPLILSGIYGITGSSVAAARIIQAVLGGITVIPVYFLGRRIKDRRTGVVAALITAAYGPLIFFDTALLATGLASLLAPALVLSAVKAREGGRVGGYVLFGVLSGLSIICRATFFPYVISALILLGIVPARKGPGNGGTALRVTAAAGAVLLILIPVTLSSGRVTGHYSPLPRSGSINLYIGNNPDSDRTVSSRPGAEWRSILTMPERNGRVSEKEYRSYFTGRFREYAVSQPASFISGLIKKTALMFSSREIPRNYDIYTIRKYSKLLSLLVWKRGGFGFPFGILLPTAVIGLFLGRKKIPVSLWLFLIIYPASVILVFASSRFRAPLIPVMAVPAAYGIVSVFEMLRCRRVKGALTAFAAALLIAVAASLYGPYVTETQDYEAELHASVGYQLSVRGKRDEAVLELREALELSPGYAQANRILGCLLQERGDNEEALEHFEKAMPEAPDPWTIHYYMGVALLNLGRRDEGLWHLNRAAEGARRARDAALYRQVESVLRAATGGR
jgi:4-amino-4-deoxy-L-arabinose transferase-like glycosyltransferase